MPDLSFVPLHDRKDLLKKSVTFLNSEWPRSDGSREHSQKKSCRPRPPMSFLLLDGETDEILGHARVTTLPNRDRALWIESVMIKKGERGRGLGKYLMNATEQWMLENDFDEAFLSTEDQCRFYESCGYQKCDPIVHSTTATSVFPAMEHFQNAAAEHHVPVRSAPSSASAITSALAPLPPPPPPLPKMVTTSTSPIQISTVEHQYMKKRLKPTTLET
ncbi:unnamed protein product [Caenorhabditis sp. 36 PRJEB53466]|nr:unnamed protein product [Caenorhabditis sp. 36 PRJEB53466]